MELHLQRQSRNGIFYPSQRGKGRLFGGFSGRLIGRGCAVAAFEHRGGVVERLGFADGHAAGTRFIVGAAASRREQAQQDGEHEVSHHMLPMKRAPPVRMEPPP
ncbi:protein of unknown function [uncultured Sphingopyxis sp.]|uniref:Uncharacterized protein n=1 Tax=uncultured Sphingopyxis sp. TaxID=310581 RepID=A0A1Y5PVR6_9SPHN|nr:protein of unknown function [uncultured Sphingopyxis sp.]